MNCVSKNIIYLMTCLGCKKIYIGETGICLNLRINLHRQQIEHKKYTILNVSTHIQKCGKSFSILPMFQLPNDCEYLRKKQEIYFINLLQPELNQ